MQAQGGGREHAEEHGEYPPPGVRVKPVRGQHTVGEPSPRRRGAHGQHKDHGEGAEGIGEERRAPFSQLGRAPQTARLSVRRRCQHDDQQHQQHQHQHSVESAHEQCFGQGRLVHAVLLHVAPQILRGKERAVRDARERISQRQHAEPRKHQQRPRLAQQMRIRLPPLAPHHHHHRQDERTLHEQREGHVAEIPLEELHTLARRVRREHLPVPRQMRRQEVRTLHERRPHRHVAQERQSESRSLRHQKVEQEDHGHAEQEGPAPALEDRARHQPGQMIEQHRRNEDQCHRPPVGERYLPAPQRERGERQGGCKHDPFPHRQPDEIAERLRQRRHRREALIVHHALVALHGHAARDLAGADDEQDQCLEREQREQRHALIHHRVQLLPLPPSAALPFHLLFQHLAVFRTPLRAFLHGLPPALPAFIAALRQDGRDERPEDGENQREEQTREQAFHAQARARVAAEDGILPDSPRGRRIKFGGGISHGWRGCPRPPGRGCLQTTTSVLQRSAPARPRP